MPKEKPYKCLVILGYEDLTREDVDAFWAQGVCMDDWDYMILVQDPDAVLDAREEPREEWTDAGIKEVMMRTRTRTRYSPRDYDLDRMLTGCCYNEWYRARFRGKEYAIGVAYHA